jgi:penicillin amidase
MLVEWDGDMRPDSVGGAIYAMLRYYLERQAYTVLGDLLHAEAGIGLFSAVAASEMLNRRALPGILERIMQTPGDQHGALLPGDERTWAEVLQESMRLAVAELRTRLGNDPQHWKYSRLHTVTLRHVLGRSSLLAPVFNRGPWPLGGDIDTVCMGYTPRDTAADAVHVVPLYRQICDTSDWDASVSVLFGGQSGHSASRHYTDMVPLWLRGDYHPMLWTRERVDEHAVATLILEPEHA